MNSKLTTWDEHKLVLYHGTDKISAEAIVEEGVDLSKCSPFADFGSGFYTTTNLMQSIRWAKLKAMRKRSKNRDADGAVISLEVDRRWLGLQNSLVFSREADETGYPIFVRHCRAGSGNHGDIGHFDVVYGPVAHWQNSLGNTELEFFTIKDCDQISFHTEDCTTVKSPLFATTKIVLYR